MIRFAIWTAVSTEEQAREGKDSLPEQQKTCRARAAAHGWQETAGPFIVEGESRTRWVNLRDAEDAIPPLRLMLDSAKRSEFDVLVCYDYTRFRDLLDPIARSLAAYGVQLYSISQPVEPVSPDQFDPYASDVASIVQNSAGMISKAEINALRRRWRIGVPGRVAKGLHTLGRLPYGYRPPPGHELDPKAVPIQDPARALIALQIKDLYLEGRSLAQIQAWLKEQHIPSPAGLPEWSDRAIRHLLRNPFYAGQVFFGQLRKVRDLRTGKGRLVPGDPAKLVTGPGQHEPLWNEATHQKILAEMGRRARKYKGPKTYRLSLLLRCSEHHRTLYVQHIRNINDEDHVIWHCTAVYGHWHVHILERQALAQISDRMIADLEKMKTELPPRADPDQTKLRRASINDLVARRERLTDALEAGSLDHATYAARRHAIDERLAAEQFKLADIEGQADRQRAQRDALAEVVEAIQASPEYLTTAPAQAVNAQLRAFIEYVVVFENGNVEIVYR